LRRKRYRKDGRPLVVAAALSNEIPALQNPLSIPKMALWQTCAYLCDLSVGELSAPKVRRSFQAANKIVTRSIGLALHGAFCVDPAGRRGFRDPQVSKSVFPEVLVTDKTTGKVIMKMEGGKAEVVGPGALLLPPPAGTRWVRPGDPGYHPGQPPLAIAASDTDKRIIDLEMKLKSILNEVVELRRERTPDLHSYGPTPMEKIPYVNQLFKAVGPATPQEQQTRAVAAERQVALDAERGAVLQKKLGQLQEQYNTENAHNVSLTAERDILQAKLKEAAHQWERERGRAEDAQTAAETALREAETNRKRLQSVGGKGVDEVAAQVYAAKKELENTKDYLEKRVSEHEITQEKLITVAAAIEAQLRDSGTNLSHLDLEIRKLTDAMGASDVPTKP
jgi:hypothetical protein